MTSPPKRVVVRCPGCGKEFEAWFRASINLSLGEEWTDEEIHEATHATCPSCDRELEIARPLIVGWPAEPTMGPGEGN